MFLVLAVLFLVTMLETGDDDWYFDEQELEKELNTEMEYIREETLEKIRRRLRPKEIPS
jgi:hypothetical protein